MGRFLQEDPIGFWGGVNFYTYCDNNPINWIDPWGLRSDAYTPHKWLEWLRRWVPEGPESVHGRWVLYDNPPNFTRIITGLEPVVVCRSDQWIEQYGHYEWFGGWMIEESGRRAYSVTHPKSRVAYPGFENIIQEPEESPYNRIFGDPRQYIRERALKQWDPRRYLGGLGL